ncbi:hypothetical protein BJF78_20135 [Pseudonocardia sp. CNS-139]|nr:hypothetical protein BJF78_20135 [Pseudonocardia sp. CNS-139]
MPPRYAGSASGIAGTTQQFGGALGVAVLGAVFFPALAAGGYGPAFTASAVVTAAALAGCAVLCLVLSPRPQPQR